MWPKHLTNAKGKIAKGRLKKNMDGSNRKDMDAKDISENILLNKNALKSPMWLFLVYVISCMPPTPSYFG